MQKRWSKPELIVVVRSRPEEAVLVACKHALVSGSINNHTGCQTWQGSLGVCRTSCFDIAVS